ncbi:hypothetical protein Tco_0146362 [Tanacetum coccineum]
MVYTDHSASSTLWPRRDAKARTPAVGSIAQEIDIENSETKKRADNLAPIICLRRENPASKQTREQRKQMKHFLSETLCSIALQDQRTPWKVQLNELNELRDQAYENSLIYKEKTKRIHDAKIKNRVFNVGDRVLLFNSRLKIFSGKLKSRWSGPFTIVQVFPYGTVELSQNSGPNFKVNGHRIKHYFGGDVPTEVVPDLQTFPMDQ